jgi:Flp pilus assembly protein TadG
MFLSKIHTILKVLVVTLLLLVVPLVTPLAGHRAYAVTTAPSTTVDDKANKKAEAAAAAAAKAQAAANTTCDSNALSGCCDAQTGCVNCNGKETAQCSDPAASGCSDGNGGVTTKQCDLVDAYLNPAIVLLSGLVGVVVVISLILGGIQYSTSGGDPQKVSAAKNRITKTIVAFVAYIFLFAFVQFLIPGGIK